MAVNDNIILGEGVEIDAGAASVVMRVASGAIDGIVMLVTYSVLASLINPLIAVSNAALGRAIAISLTVLWFVVVPATVETLTRGRSIGRIAVGLRIVRDDGGPISARYAFGRALVGLLEIYMTLGMVAATASFLSERGKRLGDMLVGTYSMRTRGGRTALPPIVMPFGLAEWASTADMRRLPDGLALTARLFLGRAAQMSHESRMRFGLDLAARVGEYVAPAPPAGTHPETFLAAVLASRRDREYAAGVRADQINHAETLRLSRLPYGIQDVEN